MGDKKWCTGCVFYVWPVWYALNLLLLSSYATGRVLPEAGGSYFQNYTLEFRNSPFVATKPIVVHPGANLTIQEGVTIQFDPGIGITVRGILHAVGSMFVGIKLIPHQTPGPQHDNVFPDLRLVDGPATNQGRLQVLSQGRWRAVCTKQTNWTDIDIGIACRSMGFGGGGFWRYYRRNNDTRPFVMPRPACRPIDKTLFNCPGMTPPVPLSENLCQGEDDLGLVCWGPPSFNGWESHWRGIEFLETPFELWPADDPNGIASKRVSKSRLEWVTIEYAGYNGHTKNATAAVYATGVPPVMNYINVIYSAGDGMRFYEPYGPVEVTNSTISHNRGHGIVVHNTSDGRVFINQTRIQHNFGDGIQYSVQRGMFFRPLIDGSRRTAINYYEPYRPDINICQLHQDKHRIYYPKVVEIWLENGTYIDPSVSEYPCYAQFNIPSNLLYTYTVQILDVQNKNPQQPRTNTSLIFCDSGPGCTNHVHKIPVYDGIFPPSIVTHNKGYGLWIGLEHTGAPNNKVIAPIRVLMQVHAQVKDHVMYGLNVSNSKVTDNLGKGIYLYRIRDRTVINNVTIVRNKHLAGIHVEQGAGDIWINNSLIDFNMGDGVNVSFCGGSTVINGTSLSNNLMRGAAFHYNETAGPFMPLSQEIIIKGRRSNSDETPTYISKNKWGGILVGNFCTNAYFAVRSPKVVINFVILKGNHYHPGFEYFSCQRSTSLVTYVEVTGSRFQRGQSFSIRIQPAVNIDASISDNRFFENRRGALIIQNHRHPQLSFLPANIRLVNNKFKQNEGPFIVSVGLNEGSPFQTMVINGQNEVRDNKVFNPFPYLNPRNRPFAAVIVSSSNIRINRNCFDNRDAMYEIATDLTEHAKIIDATENSWGRPTPERFMPKVFDSSKRYNLAKFDLDPYATLCNSHNPQLTPFLRYIPPFRDHQDPTRLGGMIYEHVDLRKGRYTIFDDLHILPGARLNIEPGTTLQFEDSIGLLVQGELLRMPTGRTSDMIVMTARDFSNPPVSNIRLVDDEETIAPTIGRLEILVDAEWGTICNRSWNVNLAAMACNQLGLIIDPEFLENWNYYPKLPGDLPIVMDNIRCEELETDIMKCRHDGPAEHVNLTCPRQNVVGVRCIKPRWAGVRYTLLANPPAVTDQEYVHHIIIEQAGLLDFSKPTFSAALQIDWNHHTFKDLIVRDNFWNGLDIVYNDLVKKPKIERSLFQRNRRNGIRCRSYGLTIEHSRIDDNENAGIRYNPILSAELQRDVVTWLKRDDLTRNQIVFLPDLGVDRINLYDSTSESRKFLVAQAGRPCGSLRVVSPESPCKQNIRVVASNVQSGSNARIGIHIINRPSNVSDELLLVRDGSMVWNVRTDLIKFPIVTNLNDIQLTYSRSFGPPALMILLFYQDAYQYLDPFIHVRYSSISGNQYAISTLHYSSVAHPDGSVINRYDKEQLWFQKVNFTRNRQMVVWVNGPLRDAQIGSPITEVHYWIDNCSVSDNNGSIIETHRDLYQSANVFHWRVWRSNFYHNDESGFSISLPDTYEPFSKRTHKFEFLENDLRGNRNFEFHLRGYYVWCNISANNFTQNQARPLLGIMRVTGMEKELVMERNRFHLNKAKWVLLWEIQSQTRRRSTTDSLMLPASIHKNYITQNYYLTDMNAPLIDNYPRSFALGVRGLQKVNVSYNNFRNELMDFEIVVGLRGATIYDSMNVTYNYWGVASGPEVVQRIFDFDDWNIYSVAQYNPYMVMEEFVHQWTWDVLNAQVDTYQPGPPVIQDLKGRIYTSIVLERQREKWSTFPYDYKPDQPYRITKDLTIMPGATLTIEKGAEIHLYPGVRILVLGALIAEGTAMEPIRFLPVNVTEIGEQEHDTTYYTSSALQPTSTTGLHRVTERQRRDTIYNRFPLLNRQDTFYQKFNVYLVGTGDPRSGFLEIYNSTTGEMVPICDRQFTRRNAQVVCRELGYETSNVYYWVAPRWDYNSRLRIVRSYSEPRQCFGFEPRLSDCDIRLNGDRDLWYCSGSLLFVFVHCGDRTALNSQKYPFHWGGITLTSPDIEHNVGTTSSLKHVEIVGAGAPHNSTDGSALELIFQSPILENVNVTNSSMHGVMVIAPKGAVNLQHVNVTHNHGTGLNVLTLNLRDDSSQNTQPLATATIPYRIFGMVDICSVGKDVVVEKRVLVYYKYDSYPVDCVKTFRSFGGLQSLSFRFLQVRLYNSHDEAGRPDLLGFYSSSDLTDANQITTIGHDSDTLSDAVSSRKPILGVHLRASAADGSYGFIAEVVTLPAAPELGTAERVQVMDSRLEYNQRGALRYASMGEKNQDVRIERCFVGQNGYHVFGNFTTSEQAVYMNLHNTLSLKFLNNQLWRNTGGLHIRAGSSTSIARLEGIIRNCGFSQNDYGETLKLVGKDFQKIYVTNNYFGKNWVPYRDVVYVNRLLTNFSYNVFYNNTGTHIIDLTGYPRVQTEFQVFYHNLVYDNIALGHGFHFNQSYGYFSPTTHNRISKRSIRQRDPTTGTSFEWWAEVGTDTERYRSTILAGTSQQHYAENFFVNPANDFELTTVNKTSYEAYHGPVDARNNWWGYPGTLSVAAGRIRDKEDYPFLIPVDYDPVLDTNQTLLDGDCPPGWFYTGRDTPNRIKSCFLFIGGAMPYHQASQFCLDNDGFMPYFQSDDPRLPILTKKLEELNRKFQTQTERYFRDPTDEVPTEIMIWVSGVMVPPEQCAYLSSDTGNIAYYNCGLMLPFVCEKGPGVATHWFILSPAGIAAIVLVVLLLIVVMVLVIFWCVKSRHRRRQYFERKNSLRDSLRSIKAAQEKAKEQERIKAFEREARVPAVSAKPRPPSPDVVGNAHARMILGDSFDSMSSSFGRSRGSVSSSKNSEMTESSTAESTAPPRKTSGRSGSARYYPKPSATSTSYTESAYRSDYSPTIDDDDAAAANFVQRSTPAVKLAATPPPGSHELPESRTQVPSTPYPRMMVPTPPKPVSVPTVPQFQRTETTFNTPGRSLPNGSSDRHPSNISSASSGCNCCNEDGIHGSQCSRSTCDHPGSQCTCSCTVTPDGSVISSARSSTSTLALGDPPFPPPPVLNGTIELAANGRQEHYHPNVNRLPPLPSFNGTTPETFIEESPSDYLQTSFTPMTDFASSGRTALLGGQRRPRPISQGTPLVSGSHNPTYAQSPSFDSLLADPMASNDSQSYSNLEWVPPHLSSFSRSSPMFTNGQNGTSFSNDMGAKQTPTKRRLPMETAM